MTRSRSPSTLPDLPDLTLLVPSRSSTVPSPITSIPISKTLIVQLHVDASPGCGGIAWPAGEVLSRCLAWRNEVDPGWLKGRKVLELGSGTGLCGIVAGLCGAQVWVTDQEPLLELMRANVTLNDVRNHVRVAAYDWGSPPADLPVDRIEMVLAADCVYFEPAFPLLVQTLCDLAPVDREVEVLFCWKKRRKADKRFFALLKKHFQWEMVDDDRPGAREVYEKEGVSLMRLKRTQ